LLDAHALAASVSQDGDRLAVILAIGSTRGGYERRLELWNVGMERRIVTRSLAPVLDADMAAYLNFAGEDRYLAVGMHDGIEIVDTKRLSSVVTLHHWGVTLTALQGDGTLAATTGRNGVVRIWDMGSRNEIAQIESANAVRGIALSNDSRWLATLEDTGSIRLWLLAPGDLIEQACYGVAETCP
jgi:WD40 repeat protein